VLDPVVALRRTVTLVAGEPQTLSFLVGAAASRPAALALVAAAGGRANPARPRVRALAPTPPDPSLPGSAPVFANGLGGFAEDGREYVLHLRRRDDGTPRPCRRGPGST
jgi:hypothetical protein